MSSSAERAEVMQAVAVLEEAGWGLVAPSGRIYNADVVQHVFDRRACSPDDSDSI